MKQHYKLIAIFLLIGIVIWLTLCNRKETRSDISIRPDIENTILKQVVSDLNHDRDSLLKVSKNKEITRIEYIDRWHVLKGRVDSIPCDSAIVLVINTCDTIILQDSSLISDLKSVIRLDSSIIETQKHLLTNDSIYIEQLQQAVKKQKRQKRLAVAGLIGISVFAILK